MISKIKNLFKQAEYKKVFENIASLTGLQFASYILPLITLPYLTYVLVGKITCLSDAKQVL